MRTETLAPVDRTGTAHAVDQRLLELFVFGLREAMEDIATLRFQRFNVTWRRFHDQSSFRNVQEAPGMSIYNDKI